jgi:hypothetical protein
MYVLGSQAGYDLHAQAALEDPPGHLRAADILSFGGIIFSSSAGWAPIAADFNCRLPATISKPYVFALTWIGLMLPLLFVESLGVMLMTVPSYAAAYADGDAGALIKKGACVDSLLRIITQYLIVFEPWGKGGDFIVVLLGLSVIAKFGTDTLLRWILAHDILATFPTRTRRVCRCKHYFHGSVSFPEHSGRSWPSLSTPWLVRICITP